MTQEVVASKPGRPRDARIDETVLRATIDLLLERGYARLSMAAIADRAGTSKPALYRRWPSKAHLVHEAVFPDRLAQLEPSPDFATAIRQMVAGTCAVFSQPAVRAAVPGLLADLSADPRLHARLVTRFQATVWDDLAARVAEGQRDGQVLPGADATTVIQLVVGAVIIGLATGRELDADWIDGTADLLLAGLLRKGKLS